MWTVAGRRFRRKTQQTTTTLLGTKLGSGSGSSGRFSAELEDQGLYLYPPWKLIPRALKRIKAQKLKRAILVTPLWPN